MTHLLKLFLSPLIQLTLVSLITSAIAHNNPALVMIASYLQSMLWWQNVGANRTYADVKWARYVYALGGSCGYCLGLWLFNHNIFAIWLVK